MRDKAEEIRELLSIPSERSFFIILSLLTEMDRHEAETMSSYVEDHISIWPIHFLNLEANGLDICSTEDILKCPSALGLIRSLSLVSMNSCYTNGIDVLSKCIRLEGLTFRKFSSMGGVSIDINRMLSNRSLDKYYLAGMRLKSLAIDRSDISHSSLRSLLDHKIASELRYLGMLGIEYANPHRIKHISFKSIEHMEIIGDHSMSYDVMMRILKSSSEKESRLFKLSVKSRFNLDRSCYSTESIRSFHEALKKSSVKQLLLEDREMY